MAGITGSISLASDGLLAFHKLVNGDVGGAIGDGIFMVASYALGDGISKAVTKHLSVTVGNNTIRYDLGKFEWSVILKDIVKDIDAGNFGKLTSELITQMIGSIKASYESAQNN
jgi:hypothetical protein